MIEEKRVTGRPLARAQASTVRVAIDLGYNAVRAVEVSMESSGDGPVTARIVRRGTAPLPAGFWSDVSSHIDGGAAAVRQALSAAGISAKTVSACLPRRLVTVRFARLPHAPPEQMKGLVAYEAQQYILFSLDEVVLDYQIVSDPLSGMMGGVADDLVTVLLAAARRNLVAAVMSVFDRAGLDLRQLSVSALALAEHLRGILEPTAIIDIEPGEMDISIVAAGRLLFTRASALDPDRGQPEVAARRLTEEVARSFTSYMSEQRQHTIATVYLTGASASGAEGNELERLLSSVIDMPVTRLQNALLHAADADAGEFATAAGLALQGGHASIASVNLVPDERAQRKATAVRRRRRQLVAVAVAALVIAGVFGADRLVRARALETTFTEDANKQLVVINTALAALKKVHDSTQALDAEMEKGLDQSHPAVDVLVALNRALPAGASLWLTQMMFDRGGLITLHGETRSSGAATDLVIALQQSRAFTDVRIGYLGDATEDTPSGSDSGATGAAPATVQPLPGLAAPERPAGQAPPAGAGAPAGSPTVQPTGGARGGSQGPPSGTPSGFGFGFGTQPNSPDTPDPSTPNNRRRRRNRDSSVPGDGNGGAPVAPAGQQPGVPGTLSPVRQGPSGAVTAALIGVPGGAPAPSRMAASGAAVPPVRTLTATVAPAARGTAPQNRPTAPTRRPSATRYAGSTRQALTSFIITCRINPHAASLIPAGLPAPHPPAGAVSVRKRTGAHAAQSPDEPSVLDENGDDSANP